MKRTFATALVLAVVLAAVPAGAQQPFRSDTRGPIVTGSGIARYPSMQARRLESALFRTGDNGQTLFRSTAVAGAMQAEAVQADSAVCDGSLQSPLEWGGRLAADSASQLAICELLHTETPGLWSPAAQRVRQRLAQARPGEYTPLSNMADSLVNALAGLMAGRPQTAEAYPGRVDSSPERYTQAGNWRAALLYYRMYLNAVPAAMMADPPHELVSIAIVLDRVVDAGLKASRQ